MTIHLSNLKFYCYHGLYEEERQVGGEYIINVEVTIETPPKPIRLLDQTVNYVAAYDLIQQRMMEPTPLLETIVMELADKLLNLSSIIQKVQVSIKKKALPIAGFQGNTGVTFSKVK